MDNVKIGQASPFQIGICFMVLYFVTEFQTDILNHCRVCRLQQWCCPSDLGWGLLSQFPPFRYFPNFSESQKHALAIEYHVYISQVSPQLSCGDTCQIWMWSKESNRYFCKIENFACGEISERSLCRESSWYKHCTGKFTFINTLFSFKLRCGCYIRLNMVPKLSYIHY